MRRALSMTAVLIAGCANRCPSSAADAATPPATARPTSDAEAPTRVQSVEAPAVSAEVRPLPGAGPSAEPETFAAAIRLREWKAAARLLDAASEVEKRQPEVRYARARVALELGDADIALSQLAGVEDSAPDFAQEILELRARAHLQKGDVDEVVAFHGGRKDAESWILAARALAEDGRYAAARLWADKALARLGRSGSRHLRAEARLLRARIAEGQKQIYRAAADYRWLALEAPWEAAATGAVEALERITPKQPLTQQERLKRARAFADRGYVERTEAELSAIVGAPGKPARQSDRTAVLARAVYLSRGDYARAAALYAQAAQESAVRRELHLFLEAKSLSRAHRDGEAVQKYQVLVKRYPGSRTADDSLYDIARLHYIAGAWPKAEAAYREYLRRRGTKGRHARDARYELGVTRLALGNWDQAAADFARERTRASSDRIKARMLHLQGVALEGAGKKNDAIEAYRKVIEERPLSFPALASAARLERLGEKAPPVIGSADDASPPPSPLSVSLPDKVVRLDRVGLDTEAEAALREREHELRKEYGKRSAEALCLAYGQLQSAHRRYQVAQWAVSWDALRVAPTPATRWQWECIYPRPYQDIIASVEKERRVPAHLIHAVMRQESAFSATVVSPAYAVGLMQIIEPTAKHIAREIGAAYEPDLMRAPAVNVRFGAFYLEKLLGMFDGRVALAAGSYNAGPRAMSRWLEGAGELPLDVFVARIPYDETRGYVYRVLGNLARYSYLAGGEKAVPKLELGLPREVRVASDAY